MNPLTKTSLLSLIASTALATGASAATIQVDFGLDTQQTETLGWNNMTSDSGGQPADLTNLVDDAGDPTGIDLTYLKTGDGSGNNPNGAGGVAGSGANYNGPYPDALDSFPTSALQDGLFFAQSGATITLTLSNLDTDLTYDFILYGARGNNGLVDTTYQVTGANDSGVINIGPVNTNDDDFADITGIAPDVNGEITITATSINGSSGNGGALNLLVVTAVPEPGSLALLSLGGVLIARRRR
ncbi:MAG: PEP-CTERM sorting domain-containing protein [Planctomycetota bacterium]